MGIATQLYAFCRVAAVATDTEKKKMSYGIETILYVLFCNECNRRLDFAMKRNEIHEQTATGFLVFPSRIGCEYTHRKRIS